MTQNRITHISSTGHVWPCTGFYENSNDHDRTAGCSCEAGRPRRGGWMQTFTGKQFWPMDPEPADLDVRDIAHGLAYQCRYNGMTTRHYSVAEHCVLMSYAVAPEYALHALLHDATEAYIGDMVRPLKDFMPEFQAVEARLWAVIADHFRISRVIPPEVHDADSRIVEDERAVLLGPEPAPWRTTPLQPLGVKVIGLPPEEAEAAYLARLAELTELQPVQSTQPLVLQPGQRVALREGSALTKLRSGDARSWTTISRAPHLTRTITGVIVGHTTVSNGWAGATAGDKGFTETSRAEAYLVAVHEKKNFIIVLPQDVTITACEPPHGLGKVVSFDWNSQLVTHTNENPDQADVISETVWMPLATDSPADIRQGVYAGVRHVFDMDTIRDPDRSNVTRPFARNSHRVALIVTSPTGEPLKIPVGATRPAGSNMLVGQEQS